MKIAIRLFAAAVASTFIATASAQLKWEQTTIELHPSVTDQETVATFKYENVGDKPIKILDVKTSCGCTVASRKKDDAAPGEKGEITATLKISGHTGIMEKQVTVTTDDEKNPQSVLTLKADVPLLLEVKPTFVFWKQGEEPTPRIIHVKANKEFPVTKLDVTSTNADIVTTVKKGEADKEWDIEVTRRPDSHPAPNAMAQLKITPDYPKDTPKVFYATVRVAPAPAAAPAPAPIQ
jgi:hypothetical protein